MRSAIRTLADSVSARRLTLTHSEAFRGITSDWQGLVAAINTVVERMIELDKRSSGLINQLEATLGNLQEGVLILDRDNYILLANNSLKNLFPELSQASNSRVESGIHSSDFLEFVQAVKRGEGDSQREMIFSEGRREVWMEVSASVVPNPASEGESWYLFVLHNITKLKRLETVRRQFVANASHELKTPVAVVKGYAETLQADHETMDLADRRRFIDAIFRHSHRLALLIDDLLSLSQLESSAASIDPEKIELSAWLKDFQSQTQSLSQGGQWVNLSVEDSPIWAALDELKFRQVMDNLVQNALKYAPNQPVMLGLSRCGNEGRIWVEDKGNGVPDKDLGRIFERFYRVDQGRSRDTGGTGLGLSIVKHIVESHGGRVWAANRAEGGLRVEIALPTVSGDSWLSEPNREIRG